LAEFGEISQWLRPIAQAAGYETPAANEGYQFLRFKYRLSAGHSLAIGEFPKNQFFQ